MRAILEECKFLNIGADATGAPSATDFQAEVVDTYGYRGVAFMVHMPSLTAAGSVYLAFQHADSSASTSLVKCDTDDYSVGLAETTTVDAGKVLVMDIKEPEKRFVSCYVDKATQATRVECFAVLYGPTDIPVTQGTADYRGVADSATFQNPTT